MLIICEINAAISQVGLGNMVLTLGASTANGARLCHEVMMGCFCTCVQPQARQIWRRDSIMQSMYLWNTMKYSKKHAIWFHQPKSSGNITSSLLFFVPQDDTFSFRCLWCCRISSPCAYLLWKVCLATMVWHAWEPCRRVILCAKSYMNNPRFGTCPAVLCEESEHVWETIANHFTCYHVYIMANQPAPPNLLPQK